MEIHFKYITSYLFVNDLGAIGLLWFFIWQLAIHGSPSEHPTITPEERDYIEESIAKLPQAKVKGSLVPENDHVKYILLAEWYVLVKCHLRVFR